MAGVVEQPCGFFAVACTRGRQTSLHPIDADVH
jgi:hypothetical protein